MYIIFTGSSDKVSFSVVMNQTAVVASADPILGAQWDWIREEGCTKMITVQNITPCSSAERYD
jgi:hypothetical protein